MIKKGFTLFELLIVVLLIGIVYGVYFFSANGGAKTIPFKIDNMRTYINAQSKLLQKDNLKLIYNFDSEVVYLTDEKNTILQSVKFKQPVTEYKLMDKEQLDVANHIRLELEGETFEPTFIFFKKGEIYSNIILNTDDNRWIYYNSYFSNESESFINQSDLIDFIKKRDYIPSVAGKVE